MNLVNSKQGKTNVLLVFVVIAIALVGLFYWFSAGGKSILEHREPADISKEEKGTGIYLKLYDEEGNEISIPDWFKVGSITGEAFTIVRHPPAPSCTAVTQCSGYETNPNIMCWSGKCVLGNVGYMDLGISVVNPATSEITFLNVAPSSATPIEWWNNLDKTTVTTLSPGDPAAFWTTTSPLSVSAWEGTQQTFSVTVSGTNQYTGQIVTPGDSIQLAFDSDPTGAFIVSIVSPI